MAKGLQSHQGRAPLFG